jgi:hypothetical protein
MHTQQRNLHSGRGSSRSLTARSSRSAAWVWMLASPWEQALLAISAVLQCYVADDDARVLLRESAGALGWDRKQKVDEELALPLLRAALTELMERYHLKVVSAVRA